MKVNARLKSLLEIELCAIRLAGKAKLLSQALLYLPRSERMVTPSEKGKERAKVKPVPEWLNCSMWSSTRPSDADAISRSCRSASKVSGGSYANAAASEALAKEDAPFPEVATAGNSSKNAVATNIDEQTHIVRDDHENQRAPVGFEENEENKQEEGGKEDDCLGQKSTATKSNHIDDPLSDSWVQPSSSSDSEGLSSSKNSKRYTSSVDSRHQKFQVELSKETIDLVALQRLASQGIPDVWGLRAIVWKLLCGYLPKSRDRWDRELSKKRAEYAAFKEELLFNPSEVTRRLEGAEGEVIQVGYENDRGFLQRSEITHGDHPLSMGRTSVWNKFFQDTEIVEQIDRDVKRTHPDMQFFSGDSLSALENQESLKRILLIFAKLNPGIRYVQGMNEVVAPLFYVFKMDSTESAVANAEADAFFCFVQLLSNFRDHFCQQLDNSVVGIRSTMSQLSLLLKRHDEELWRHLEITTKVNPQFYAFRWITLLLTQEFSFPDCLRIWDSLLSNQDGPLEILLRICCAMLMCIRSRLLGGDFTINLKLLQHYPYVDTNHLLQLAEDLRNKTTY